MEKNNHILIISDNENSEVVKVVSSLKFIPIIRKSILTAVNLLRHHEIPAIIIDKEYQNVDALELILNARDFLEEIVIIVPEQYFQNEDWSIVIQNVKILLYNHQKYPLKEEIKNLLNINHNIEV